MTTDILALLQETHKKIKMVSTFTLPDGRPYISIEFSGRRNRMYSTQLLLSDVPLLLQGFSISSIKGQEYVQLKGRYLHQAIAGDCPKGCLVHHVIHPLWNVKDDLQVVDRGLHSKFHRELKAKKAFTLTPLPALGPTGVCHSVTKQDSKRTGRNLKRSLRS